MWVRVSPEQGSGTCGGFFRCGAGHTAVRCGSRYFRPAPGQLRLNCSCEGRAMPRPRKRHLREAAMARHTPGAGACGAHASVDDSGGVSAAYRRLPLVPSRRGAANPSLKCCRNKPNAAGGIDWQVTLKFTPLGFAPWPSECEVLCDKHPRCRFFSHSVKFKSARPRSRAGLPARPSRLAPSRPSLWPCAQAASFALRAHLRSCWATIRSHLLSARRKTRAGSMSRGWCEWDRICAFYQGSACRLNSFL